MTTNNDTSTEKTWVVKQLVKDGIFRAMEPNILISGNDWTPVTEAQATFLKSVSLNPFHKSGTPVSDPRFLALPIDEYEIALADAKQELTAAAASEAEAIAERAVRKHIEARLTDAANLVESRKAVSNGS